MALLILWYFHVDASHHHYNLRYHVELKEELKEELGVKTEAGDIFCESIYKYDHGEFQIFSISTKLHSTEFELRSQ